MRKGFTLLEVIVAAAVLAVCVVPLLDYFTTVSWKEPSLPKVELSLSRLVMDYRALRVAP